MKECFSATKTGYEYRFRYKGNRYSVSGKTKKECKERANKRKQEIDLGLKKSANTITFKDYSQEWLEGKKVTVKESTIHSYEKKLKMLSSLDKKKMQEIDRRDIIKLQSNLSKKYCSSSVNWLISKTKEIFNSAIADDIVAKNPVIQIKPLKRTEPKATKTIHRALSKDEQEQFFARAKKQNSWYLELFELMIVTGMRVGEAGALKWGDIDTKIHITQTVAQVGSSKYVLQPAKTDAGVRDLPLTKDAKDILARQKIRLAQHRGISYTASDRQVFITFQKGNLINPSLVDSALDHICKKANMEKFTSHAFRDTYATRCILQGMQPNTLKTLMGHTKIEITMDLYAQVFPEDMEEAMAKISIL